METVTSGWTNERLDDLKQEVEKQGRRMDDGFRDLRSEMGDLRRGLRSDMGDLRSEMGDLRKGLRSEMGDLRSEMGNLRGEMDARFDRLEVRFDTMLYALLAFGGAMFAAMASLVAALIVTQL
jgi:hypothetical protein